MTRRYRILEHESGDRDGGTEEGTIVLHIGGSTAIEAQSIEDAEEAVRRQVSSNKRHKGCVYQILPPAGSTESLRALAVALSGEFRSCSLDKGSGLYSEFRRIHYAGQTQALNLVA